MEVANGKWPIPLAEEPVYLMFPIAALLHVPYMHACPYLRVGGQLKCALKDSMSTSRLDFQGLVAHPGFPMPNSKLMDPS